MGERRHQIRGLQGHGTTRARPPEVMNLLGRLSLSFVLSFVPPRRPCQFVTAVVALSGRLGE